MSQFRSAIAPKPGVVAKRNGKPAHVDARPRLRQSEINARRAATEHGR